MKRQFLLTTAFTILSLLLFISSLLAVVPGDPGGDPDEIPIDGGLSLLIAAGVAYGAKKAYDKRKKDKTVQRNSKEIE